MKEDEIVKRRSSQSFLFILLLAAAFLGVTVVLNGTVADKSNTVASQETCVPSDYTGEATSEKFAFFEGRTIPVPAALHAQKEKQQTSVLGESADSRWIEVDLSEQKLRAWDGSELFLETPVSTGLPWSPTPTGEFRIWIKLRATKMEGGSGKYYYNLPNVPYVMYFNKGYGLHGTYWHNDFGRPHSHGCVNLPTPVAEKLYYWVGPVLSDGKGSTRSSPENPGTRVVVHE